MELSPRFAEAVAYAARVHACQVRKGNDAPFISHPLGVASIALEHGADEEEAIAALLHDVIEDHGPAHREVIQSRFGPRVLEIVLGCSDSEGEPKPPWKVRKQLYLDHLPEMTASVHLVSAADKLHNVRSISRDYRRLGEALWPRFRGGRNGTLWYYSVLRDLLVKAPETLQAEFRAACRELSELTSAARPE